LGEYLIKQKEKPLYAVVSVLW